MRKIFNFLHHLFIPREDNNFRAKALHIDFLTYYLLIAIFATFAFKYTPLSNVLGYATDITIEKLYQLTNEERRKNGLPALAYSEKLSQAATKKGQDMFAKNYWAHYAPDGKTPWDFILGTGYQYEYAGENLAKNFLFSEGVVSAWMNSPTHRANILRKDYTEVGFAVLNGTLNGEPTTLVVQMFGKPLPPSIAQNPPAVIPSPPPAESTENLAIGKAAILAKQSINQKFNLANLSFNINLVFFIFLLLAVGLDFYFAYRMRLIRIGGKNLAHFIFISFLFIGLLIASRGAIL
ncbi:MAG: CAP domain-containing protein [Microgenomates group bacterium]